MTEVDKSKISAERRHEQTGPLTRRVLEFVEAQKRLLPTVKTPSDWAPLMEFAAVDEYHRVGCLLEENDWQQFTEMLTNWASRTPKFETSTIRISEVEDAVYFEIEERHFRQGRVDVVHSMTIFEFNDAGKIRNMRVYWRPEASYSCLS
jgi:hypothetical protein